jgi:Arc/MetJ family transcription regulator
MKTRIPVDTLLLEQVLAVTGADSTREVVEAALRSLLRLHARATSDHQQLALPLLREDLAA